MVQPCTTFVGENFHMKNQRNTKDTTHKP